MDKQRLLELAGIEQLDENRIESDFHEKLKAWGEALLESERIDKLARAGEDGWDEEIAEKAPNLDKLRGPMHTALNRYAKQIAKK